MTIYDIIEESKNSSNEVLWDRHECASKTDDDVYDIATDKFTFIGGKENFTPQEMNYIKDKISSAVANILNSRHLTISVDIKISKLKGKKAQYRD